MNFFSWRRLTTAQRHEQARQAGIKHGRLIGPVDPSSPAEFGQVAMVMHLFKQGSQPRTAKAEAEWQAFMDGVHHVVLGPQQLDLFRSNP